MLVMGLTRYNAIVYFVFRLKDENGEELYPRSSFLINCRGISFFFVVFVYAPFVSVEVIWSLLLESGDVCKGDVVMFVQKVYSKYSVVPFPFMPYTLTLWCLILDCEFSIALLIKFLVLNRFNKVTRHGKILGRRTVAGRVVKESYGSAKQQHTFTVSLSSLVKNLSWFGCHVTSVWVP